MVAPQRTLLMLAVLVAVGAVSCSNSSSEPIADRPRLVGGKWKGAARLDTIRLQLVDQVTGDYQPFNVDGTGTYSQTATNSSWSLTVWGFGDEIWLTSARHKPLMFRVSAVEENRLTGMLLVRGTDPTGNGVVTFEDSMPFSALRQP